MITPEEFPYIKNLHVNSCYTYTNFNVELHEYKPFSHLILTGKNGSGKTTILNGINHHLIILLGIGSEYRHDPAELASSLFYQSKSDYMQAMKEGGDWSEFHIKTKRMGELNKIRIYEDYLHDKVYADRMTKIDNRYVIFSSFEARRRTDSADVEMPTKESEFMKAIKDPESGDFLNKNFQQYLVNKRVNQAFDRLDNHEEAIKATELFFDKLTDTLRAIFNDEKLILRFIRERYETLVVLSDGREIGLKHLPAGFSGLLRIVLDLLIRVDLVRKQVANNSYDPCGIVLIDEPEVHLHLELQEQVLPLLTSLFPNIQFIVATHSPAVIASIKNTTIFDLTTKETRTSEEVVGREYSDLMTWHFGLENEYSSIADKIIKQIDDAFDTYVSDSDSLNQRLKVIYEEQGHLLSPTLLVKLEYMLAQHAARQAVAK